VELVRLRLPLALGRATDALARSRARVHELRPARTVSVVQDKRTPERVDAVAAVLHGDEPLELGTSADAPLLAATDGAHYALATIAFLAARDPQALRFDPRAVHLDVDWQSEEMAIGGARGIWSRAVVDFGRAAGADLATRGTALAAHATRRLVGVPSPSYLATTRARGLYPDGALDGAFARFDRDLDRVHARTAEYLRQTRITGTQLWPDLPRSICVGLACARYFEGGDANYWDWSLAELDAFVRTADPSFLHDFALAEAITMAETISFRPGAPTEERRSSFAGFSPCYGPGRDETGEWREGLNHRLGNCPGDYSYNKVHQLAYLLTADRRFTDYFDEGAETAIALYGAPKPRPDRWLELSASRTAVQYLELLLDAAELSRGDVAATRRHRDHAIAYLRHMSTRALANGHTCELLGRGVDDPRRAGRCDSLPGWMLAPWVDWISRLAELYDVPEARAWLVAFAIESPRRHGLVDARGAPVEDVERWFTRYRCRASAKGIDDASCAGLTEGEDGGRFYPNGAVAYLGALALALEADPSDPAGLCAWLPAAYARALDGLDGQNNGWVWGKALGQAYAFAQRALGALSRCR
ncbi:hypothetical protein L6R52_42890, partial [Myxococcota bacterium]|nr:hypothetical protein [Myxococcota bacterium]